WRTFGQHLPVVEHGDPISEVHDDLHIMLNDQNGEALGDTAHKLHGVTRFRRTHAGSWLVEAEQCGLGCEGNADFEIALLAMRKIGSQLVAPVVKADRFKYGLRFLDDVVVGAVMLEHAPAMPAR